MIFLARAQDHGRVRNAGSPSAASSSAMSGEQGWNTENDPGAACVRKAGAAVSIHVHLQPDQNQSSSIRFPTECTGKRIGNALFSCSTEECGASSELSLKLVMFSSVSDPPKAQSHEPTLGINNPVILLERERAMQPSHKRKLGFVFHRLESPQQHLRTCESHGEKEIQ